MRGRGRTIKSAPGLLWLSGLVQVDVLRGGLGGVAGRGRGGGGDDAADGERVAADADAGDGDKPEGDFCADFGDAVAGGIFAADVGAVGGDGVHQGDGDKRGVGDDGLGSWGGGGGEDVDRKVVVGGVDQEAECAVCAAVFTGNRGGGGEGSVDKQGRRGKVCGGRRWAGTGSGQGSHFQCCNRRWAQ